MTIRRLPHYAEVKGQNKSRILRALSAAPSTRVDLARSVGLSPATITSLVRELMAEGLVQETGSLESIGGRRPVVLEFNPGARRAVGLSIAEHRLQAVVVNLDGKILHFAERPVETSEPGIIVDQLEHLAREVVAGAGIDWDRVAGVGVAVPGAVDSEQGVVLLTTVMGWRNLPLGSLLSERLQRPVMVQRNGNAAALAEAYFGQGEVQPNLLYLNLGTGIGAGIILDGVIYSGVTGRAGEAGHMVVDPNGPVCRCGNRGCLEAVASGPAVAERAREAVRQGRGDVILRLAGGVPANITAETVAEAARNGDATAVAIMEDTGRWIGLVIAGLVNLMDIHMVVLGGGLSQAGPVLLDPIVGKAKAGVLQVQGPALRIRPSTLWPRAGVMGAATLVVEQVLRHTEKEVESSRA